MDKHDYDGSSAASIFNGLLQQLSGLNELNGYLHCETLQLPVGSLFVDIITSSTLVNLKKINLQLPFSSKRLTIIGLDPHTTAVGTFPCLQDLTLHNLAIEDSSNTLYEICTCIPSLKSLTIDIKCPPVQQQDLLPAAFDQSLTTIPSTPMGITSCPLLITTLRLYSCPLFHMKQLLTLNPNVESLYLCRNSLLPQSIGDDILSYISRSFSKLQSLTLYDISCSSEVFIQLISKCAQSRLSELHISFLAYFYTPNDLQSMVSCLHMLIPSLKSLSVIYQRVYCDHLIYLLFNQTEAATNQPSLPSLTSIEIYFLDHFTITSDDNRDAVLMQLLLDQYSDLKKTKVVNCRSNFLDSIKVDKESPSKQTESFELDFTSMVSRALHRDNLLHVLVTNYSHLVSLHLTKIALSKDCLQTLQEGCQCLSSLYIEYSSNLQEELTWFERWCMPTLQLPTKELWYSLNELILYHVHSIDLGCLKAFIARKRLNREHTTAKKRQQAIVASTGGENQPNRTKSSLVITLLGCNQFMDNRTLLKEL